MHLIFERSNGRFKSNCNILSLAWMPYYNESKFREALFDYHQKQLMSMANDGANSNNNINNQAPAARGQSESSQRPNGEIVSTAPRHDSRQRSRITMGHHNQLPPAGPAQAHASNQAVSPDDQRPRLEDLSNSRLVELYQRYSLMNYGPLASRSSRTGRRQQSNDDHSGPSSVNPIETDTQRLFMATQAGNMSEINRELDSKYGRLSDFGWLAVGNVGRMIGITLTATVAPPVEIDGRQSSEMSERRKRKRKRGSVKSKTEDLIVLDDDDHITNQQAAQLKRQSLTGPDAEFERIRPDRKSARTNYNLRGHLDEVIIVKWNELYQKLATVDSKGNVLIWCKVNKKFTVQTPFYNRTKSVADFKWSNDGKTALICYTDSFILVGSSSGQRHWHSMLNLEDYHITCASWTPNDEQLLLGVSNGNIVVIDLTRSELTELVVSQVNIRAMCWSSSGLSLRDLSKGAPALSQSDNESAHDRLPPSSVTRRNSIVVNHRRLSRDCSVFSRIRNCSQALSSPPVPPNAGSHQQEQHQHHDQLAFNSSCPPSSNGSHAMRNLRSSVGGPARHTAPPKQVGVVPAAQDNILAVDLADNTIRLYVGGLNDQHFQPPKQIRPQLESYIMAWSCDGQTLAVAGFNIYTSAPSIGCLRCRYMNVIKFYNRRGKLVHEYEMRYSRYPITAFTWAHDDRRVFVATGPKLHCAQLITKLPSLATLALSCIQRRTKLADKIDVLENLLLGKQVSFNLLNWQSFNCPLEIEGGSNANEEALKVASPTSIRTNLDSRTQIPFINNTNVSRLQIHAKLSSELDKLFAQTIRQPFDDQLSLNDIAWLVPKNNQRLYCTLVCYTSELLDAGHQYRTVELQETQSASGGLLLPSPSSANDQYKIFVLYVEFLGSLIPILKARRIGFLKPEFVIFEPEDNPMRSLLMQRRQQQKVSDVCSMGGHAKLVTNGPTGPLLISGDSAAFKKLDSNCSSLHSDSFFWHPRSNGDSKLLSCDNEPEPSLGLARGSRDRNSCGSSFEPTSELAYAQLLAEQANRGASGVATRKALDRSRRFATARVGGSTISRSLPETNELVRIRSNIWGTKFKMINVGNHMIKQRRVHLGFVEYKASILHLQPRQICLRMRDMSNYCVLCSAHHHSSARLVDAGRQREQSKRYSSANKALPSGAASYATSLLDAPINSPLFAGSAAAANPAAVAPPLPPRSSQQLQAGQHGTTLEPIRTGAPRRGSAERTRGSATLGGDNKVVLVVGDSVRIAPKLEPNQSYKLQARSNSALRASPGALSQSSWRQSRSDRLSSGTAMQSASRQQAPGFLHQPRPSSSLGCASHFDRTASSIGNNNDDDILTLSLDQGDQVRVSMASLSANEASQATSITKGANTDEFLNANKTLKSIQTITKMIVDLSSRASDDDDDDDDEKLDASYAASPSKLLKTKPQSDVSSTSARQYVAPEAPVHRPKLNRLCSDLNTNGRSHSGIPFDRSTQSATSTPRRSIPVQRRRKRAASQRGNANEIGTFERLLRSELPPPPPSVPFGRRLSSTAKRLFDGSLRSLTGASGYSTATELDDSEECEPLVSGVTSSRLNRQRAALLALQNQGAFMCSARLPTRHAMSQPPTPTRSRGEIKQLDRRKQSLDLSQLKEQLLQRLRDSTRNWRASSCESARAPTSYTNRAREQSPGASSSRSDQLSDRSDDEDEDEEEGEEEEDDDYSFSSDDEQGPHLYAAHKPHQSEEQDRWRARTNRAPRWSSAKNLSAHGANSLQSPNRTPGQASNRQPLVITANSGGNKPEGARRKVRKELRPKRAICDNLSCCCAKEFKLSNRPPVWNEQSQVYQLDFSGRVTQESAKNLQIDFEGNLALQFGRIDRCTYTLDYKYPFNGVQAMAVALASLTQRLK